MAGSREQPELLPAGPVPCQTLRRRSCGASLSRCSSATRYGSVMAAYRANRLPARLVLLCCIVL